MARLIAMLANPVYRPMQKLPDDLSSEGDVPLGRGKPRYHQRQEVSLSTLITLLYLEGAADRREV